MSARYDDRELVVNDLKMYKSIMVRRGAKNITMFATPELLHPTLKEIEGLNLEAHRWTVGDRFYKLADRYYDDSRLWWVIAQFNKTPTEAHVKLGDLLYIPLPLERIMRAYGK